MFGFEADLQTLMGKEEPLHEDLAGHVREGGVFPMIHHPLIIDIPYSPAMNAVVNARYKMKLAKLEECRADREWHSYVFFHERPYRMDAMHELIGEGVLSDREKWELISAVWTDSENIWESLDVWRDLWNEGGYDRTYVMGDAELAALAQLPGQFQIWRGESRGRAGEGLSWTTDRDKAVWFAQRWKGSEGHRPRLMTGIVNKSDVLAYFLGRGESEIVTFPDYVGGLERERI